jgi:hypothetical protein
LIRDRKIAVQIIINIIQLVPDRFLNPVRGRLVEPGGVILVINPDLSGKDKLTGVEKLMGTGGFAKGERVVGITGDS